MEAKSWQPLWTGVARRSEDPEGISVTSSTKASIRRSRSVKEDVSDGVGEAQPSKSSRPVEDDSTCPTDSPGPTSSLLLLVLLAGASKTGMVLPVFRVLALFVLHIFAALHCTTRRSKFWRLFKISRIQYREG